MAKTPRGEKLRKKAVKALSHKGYIGNKQANLQSVSEAIEETLKAKPDCDQKDIIDGIKEVVEFEQKFRSSLGRLAIIDGDTDEDMERSKQVIKLLTTLNANGVEVENTANLEQDAVEKQELLQSIINNIELAVVKAEGKNRLEVWKDAVTASSRLSHALKDKPSVLACLIHLIGSPDARAVKDAANYLNSMGALTVAVSAAGIAAKEALGAGDDISKHLDILTVLDKKIPPESDDGKDKRCTRIRGGSQAENWHALLLYAANTLDENEDKFERHKVIRYVKIVLNAA